MVGREHELATLCSAVDAAIQGSGSVWFLHGEPGVGKTRLATEVLRYAADRGALTTVATSWNHGGAPPFWPWVQVLRALDRDDAPMAGASVPTDDHDRFALFDATVRHLRDAASNQPIVVLLDDLHDADIATLLLLRFVAAAITDGRIMVIGTYRHIDLHQRADLGNEAAEHVQQAARSGGSMPLTGLSLDEVDQLLADHLDRSPEPWLVTKVFELTSGNPLFVQHLAPAVRHSAREHDTMAAPLDLPLDLPDGIRRLLAGRLDWLAPSERELLRTAAIIGMAADLSTLGEIEGVGTDQVVARAARSVEHEFVTVDERHLSFTHPLLREVLLDEVEPAHRQATHARLAELLEREHGDESADEIAHHLLHAGPDHAIEAARTSAVAGRRAIDSFAFEDAIGHYRRGLAALAALAAIETDTRGEHRRLELTMSIELGRTCWRAGRRPECDAVFDRAWDLARDIDDPLLLAETALGGGFTKAFAVTYPNERVERCQFALARVGTDPSSQRSLLLAKLASELVGHPDQDLARTAAHEALEIARHLDEDRCIGEALAAVIITDLGPDHTEARIAMADEMLDIARRRNDLALAVQARFQLVGALVERGDRAKLDAVIRDQHREVDELAEPGYLRHDVWFRAMAATVDGDVVGAEQLIDQGLAASTVADDPDGSLVWGGQLGVIRWMQGRVDEFEPLYRDMAASSPEPVWSAILAWLWSRSGLTTPARGLLDRIGGQDFTDIPRDRHWFLAMSTAAEAAARVGDVGHARALHELLHPYRDRMAPIAMGISYWGTVARPLAMLEFTLERPDAGIELLEAAVASTARFGALPWLVEAQLDLADALVRHRHHDIAAHDRAAVLVDEALAAATRLGFVELAERAAVAHARLPRTAATPPVPLLQETGQVRRPRVEVLGGFRCSDIDGTEIHWNSRKARAVLKLLVSARGARLTRDTIIELLWPADDPVLVGNRLSVAISTIRRSLDPHHDLPRDTFVRADRHTVWLDSSMMEVDLDHFLQLARTAAVLHRRCPEPVAEPAVLAALQEAAGAYGGTAFADDPYESWWTAAREEARSTFVEVCHSIATIAVGSGRHTIAAAALRDALEADPYDERAHLALIGLHESRGAFGLAELANTRYRETLIDDVG